MGTWKYPAEFRSDAVELVRSSGRSFASVARELGINQETLRHWVRSSERSQQSQGSGDASADSELVRLRNEVAELKTEREILRKAAAYFADLNVGQRYRDRVGRP